LFQLIPGVAQGSAAPRFIYRSSALSRGLALASFAHSDRHADAATHVLRRVLQQFGSWSQWEQHCNGGFLPPDEVDRRVGAYLTRLRCERVISVAWDHSIVAPTMLAGRRLLLRGPYREGRVQSVSASLPSPVQHASADARLQVLDHEIGTHFVRKYNGKLQAKAANKAKYPIQVRLETEEVRRCAVFASHVPQLTHVGQGLASINTVLAQRHVSRPRPSTPCAPNPHRFSALHRRCRFELLGRVRRPAHGLRRAAALPARLRGQR
jgi:hypothetical protein